MNKWNELFTGLFLLIASILVGYYTAGIGFWDFGTPAWEFLKGGLIWGVIILGILFLILGITDLKN
jgi:hypothetical protein